MSKISWLHISDLHMNQTGTETERLRKKLVEYLKVKYHSFDYVFITGDLRYAPTLSTGYSEDTVPYIRELIEALSVPVNRLYIVPGNHDISRDNIKRLQAIQHICDPQTGYYSSSQGDIRDEDLIDITNGKNDFKKLISEIYEDNPDRIEYYTENAAPCFTIQTDDLNIVHLDSTITYSKEHEKDLIVGTKFLYDEITSLPPDKTNIILTHYSFDFLSREEQSQIEHILKENNVRLWLAGHEHNKLIRKQRDGFYEFQAGNLLQESAARSCVLTGSLDTATGKGTLQAHYWVSPDCWDQYPALCHGTEDDATYRFNIKSENISSLNEYSSTKPIFREIDDKLYAVNIKSLSVKDLENITDSQFEGIKEQLGTRLNGTETRQEVLHLFIAELKMTLNSDKRYDCMPLFEHVLRGKYIGHLFTDDNNLPDDQVTILHYFIENFDKYIIYGDKYTLEVHTINTDVTRVFFQYNLSSFENVYDRLYAYKKIEKIHSAHTVRIMDLENKGISILMHSLGHVGTEWNDEKEACAFWIDWLDKISKIERHFGIKFCLPAKATENDHLAIEILSDSIDRKCCCTLPGFPTSRRDFPSTIRKLIETEEYILTEDVNLPEIKLFGHTFKPVRQYSIPCKLVWKKDKRTWETKEGGVPTGVEFKAI